MARRRRRERVAGGVLAGIGVLVLVVAIIAIRNPNPNGTSAGSPTRTVTQSITNPVSPNPSQSTSSRASFSSSAPTTTTSSSSPGLVGSLPLIVLNNTSTPDLATQAGDQFKAGGWMVTSIDESYQNNIISTVAYYDPDVGNAQAGAEALQQQFPAIKRVVPRFAELPDGPIVVVLTSDYAPN